MCHIRCFSVLLWCVCGSGRVSCLSSTLRNPLSQSPFPHNIIYACIHAHLPACAEFGCKRNYVFDCLHFGCSSRCFPVRNRSVCESWETARKLDDEKWISEMERKCDRVVLKSRRPFLSCFLPCGRLQLLIFLARQSRCVFILTWSIFRLMPHQDP